jgi:hypothetical protein
MVDRGGYLGRFRRNNAIRMNLAEADPILQQRQEELGFLQATGAVDEVVEKATELRRRFRDVKLGIANPSPDNPMDIVLSWGEHSPHFKSKPLLRAWNTVIVGTAMVGGERRLTLNRRVLEKDTPFLHQLLKQAASKPIKREFEASKLGLVREDQIENEKYFASERQMKGRKKIRIRKTNKY